jgi:hypothetical protein
MSLADVVHHDHEVLRSTPPARLGDRGREGVLELAEPDRCDQQAEGREQSVPRARRDRQAGLRAPRANKTRLPARSTPASGCPSRCSRTADIVISRLQSGLPVLASVGPRRRSSDCSARSGASTTPDRDQPRGPGLDRQGRGPRRRSLDHDRHRPRVAVPAVLGYNVLLRRNKSVQERVSHFAHELHAYTDLGREAGPRRGQHGAGRPASPPAAALARTSRPWP